MFQFGLRFPGIGFRVMVCWINKTFEGFRSVRSVNYLGSGWFSSRCYHCSPFPAFFVLDFIFEDRIKGFQGFRSVRSVTFYSGSGWFSTRCYHSLPLFFLLFFVLSCIFEGLGGFRVTVLSAGFVGKIFPQKFRKRFSRLSTIVAFASFSFVFYDVFSRALIAQICVDDCFATRLCSSGCRLLFCVSSTLVFFPKHLFRFFAPLPCGLQSNVFAFPRHENPPGLVGTTRSHAARKSTRLGNVGSGPFRTFLLGFSHEKLRLHVKIELSPTFWTPPKMGFV